MTSSPLIAAIRQRLNEAGYDDLPTPFRIELPRVLWRRNDPRGKKDS
ncbi:hypothetical protein [Acetobacter oeni]|nr:hypothetical protein [Acetobacter oeni]MBB3882732.1 hypothetical protein [Acetobacter oeni]